MLNNLVVLLLVASTLAASESGLAISKISRDIYLKGKYVRISYEISLQNNGSTTSAQYLHSVHPSYASSLIDILIFNKDYLELAYTKKSDTSFVTTLSLRPGEKTNLKILELYKNRLVPKPPEMALEVDEQKVEFIDNLYIYSAYPIQYQQTLLTVPNGNRIEYYTKTEASINNNAGTVQYGPLYGVYKEEELRVHYELATPLIYFPHVEKQFELSHLGSIAITEQYALRNNATMLKGEFDRVKYMSLLRYQHSNHIFRKLYTQLPRKAYALYYRDIIGNVSTSVATREASYVFFEITPRFPVLGGWQTKWEQGYKLLNQYYIKYDYDNPDLYIFNNTFGYAFKKITADKYKMSVMLPPTAHDIKVYLPFKAEVKIETQKSYLDIEARKVIVIEKENMHSYYAKNFLVTYRITASGMYTKFILMIVFFMIFYAVIITFSRVNLKLD